MSITEDKQSPETKDVTFPDPSLNGDLERFSVSHSYYKHLCLSLPTKFTVICAQEPQPGNERSNRPLTKALHWYFGEDDRWTSLFKDKRVVDIMEKHSVPLNPFVYGEYRAHFAIEECDKACASTDGFVGWLREHKYNEAADAVVAFKLRNPGGGYEFYITAAEFSKTDEDKKACMLVRQLRDTEYARQVGDLQEACRKVWTDLHAIGYSYDSLNQPFSAWLQPTHV